MAGRMKLVDIWWAKELAHIYNVITKHTLELLNDEAVDELHSTSSHISNMVTDEYRKRMGVIVSEVSELHRD
jgi:bifunctional pyridoxal-dependent enzyme with beta-cystathionase and maltose regulon repressor activities